MILVEEILNAGGEIEVITNPLYSMDNMFKYTRSYKVNRDGVELLRYCNNRRNGCGGRGFRMGQNTSGLVYVESCPCIEKTLEKLEKKIG